MGVDKSMMHLYSPKGKPLGIHMDFLAFLSNLLRLTYRALVFVYLKTLLSYTAWM